MAWPRPTSRVRGNMAAQSRREILRFVGIGGGAALLAACTQAPPAQPTAAPVTKPAAAAQPQDVDWQKVVDDAKKEGHLLVATYAGTGYRKVMDAFEAAYPGITVDQTPFQSSSRDFFPRYFQERQAGLYQWDILLVPATEPLVQAVPVGAIDPIRPLIVRPDVLDDKNWSDGFEGGFLDKGKQYDYAITRRRSQSLWHDTNQVKEGEIKSYKDLLHPKWKANTLPANLPTNRPPF